MRTRHLLLLAVFLLLVAPGCVSKKKHLQSAKDAADREAVLQQKVKDLEAKVSELEASLSGEKQAGATKSAELSGTIAELEAKLAAKEAERAALEAERAKLQGELATLVKDKSALKGSVEDMQRALDELARRKAESDSRVAEFRKLLERFKDLIDAGKLKVKIVDGRMVVALATDVLFARASATLSTYGKKASGEEAKVIASIPGRKYQVEGHTDDVPIKTAQYPSNWELASGRALTVVKTMIDAGVSADRISGASFGESKPAVANTSPDGRTANRRIEIVVVPDLSSLPGFDERNRAAAAR